MTKLRFLTGVFALFVGSACGEAGPMDGTGDDSTAQEEDPSSAADDDGDDSAQAGDGDGESDADGTVDGSPDDDSAGDGAADGDGASDGDGAGDGDAAGDGDGDGTSEARPTLPEPSIDCPELSDGYVMFGARRVRIYMDAAAVDKDGPVVFYWYATYGQPEQVSYAMGSANIAKITALGGIVAAPVHVNDSQFPWLDPSTMQQDFTLADDVIACAEQKIGIDQRHIHAFGMSAGGLFTTQLSYARASYFASVAAFSGGDSGTFSDASNKFAALVFYGGASDNVFGKDFEAAANAWVGSLRGSGHKALVCNHGGGHTIPAAGGAAVTDFFLAHPYGVKWGYEAGLPDAIPDYCKSE